MDKLIKLYRYPYHYILNLIEKEKSVFRFILVGCLNTAVDFLIFSLFYSTFGFNKLFCQVFGYSAGIANSFTFNKFWTFEDAKSKMGNINQIFRFLFINAVSLGISLLGLKLLSEGYNFNIYLSKIIVTGLCQIINYLGYKIWVFSNGY